MSVDVEIYASSARAPRRPARGEGRSAPDNPAEVFGRLPRELAETHGVTPTLQEIVDCATGVVPCDWAAAVVADRITPHPARLAATTDEQVMAVVADIAGRAGTSPGWLAFDEGSVVLCRDLRHETRFRGYPRDMVARTPIRSVLSLGLRLHQDTIGVMTLYAAVPNTFVQDAIERATLLADHAVIAIDAELSSQRAETLEVALTNSRVIGVAVGILVERHRLTPEQAFDLLRRVSNDTNRKLVEVAETLTTTGEFAVPRSTV